MCKTHKIEELRFVPNSNDVSFIVDDKIYVWKYDQKSYIEIYQFNNSGYETLGFAYEWKNEDEIYMMHSGNFVLYNLKNHKKEIIIKDIGKVYFNMSDDGQYFVFQEQRGEKREIILFDINSDERRKIYVAKSPYYKVNVDFAPGGRYIFMLDHNRDNHLGKKYPFLYDMETDRKYRIKIDYPGWGFIGW